MMADTGLRRWRFISGLTAEENMEDKGIDGPNSLSRITNNNNNNMTAMCVRKNVTMKSLRASNVVVEKQ